MSAQYGPLKDAAEMCCFAIVILGVLQIPANFTLGIASYPCRQSLYRFCTS